jgi:hypothetical protein
MNEHNTLQQSIPDSVLERHEPYGDGWKGVIDQRKGAIREVAALLVDQDVSPSPETAALSARLRQIGQTVVARLWFLLAQLEQHERAVTHLHEELQATRERLSDLPEFRYDEPRDIAKARYGVEQLRSQLGHELRETHRRWLEARGDIEKEVAELLTEYGAVLNRAGQVSDQSRPHPSLSQVLAFLGLPPAQDVIILNSSEQCEGAPALSA